ncbi:electron transfer flavoprotein subunit alpha/FixB family protein [Lactovum odontotermitis]
MFKVLIFLERKKLSSCLELTGLAQKLRQENEAIETYGFGAGILPENAAGLDYLIQNTADSFSAAQLTNPRTAAAHLSDLQNQFQFDCILILADSFGRMLAPRVAYRLATGLVADVIDARHEKNERLLVRPAFSGEKMASIGCVRKPMMASVHPGVFRAIVSQKLPEVIEISEGSQPASASDLSILSCREKPKLGDIQKSRVLVSGGNGVKEHFGALAPLAQALNGQVSATRLLVDAGIAVRDIQVGQSGKTVSPDLYIALGISGSLQHVVGLKNVKHLISVNTNPAAPINTLADIAIEGDAVEFIKKLTNKITAERH